MSKRRSLIYLSARYDQSALVAERYYKSAEDIRSAGHPMQVTTHVLVVEKHPDDHHGAVRSVYEQELAQ